MRSITSAALAAAVAGALALGAVQMASAQSDQGQGGQGDRRACMPDAMAKLNLSDEQKAKLKELHDSGVKVSRPPGSHGEDPLARAAGATARRP